MRFLSIVAALCIALPAQAWNATGHRIVAAIAYDRLTPKARAQVDAWLAQHPDRATLLAGDARAAFLAAATWPDLIRSDSRFYDDTRAGATPTPLLAGFPSMARHTNWHYVDIPFSPDGTPLEQPKLPNALQQLERILKEVTRLVAGASYDLPWLIHLTGDVHQPLHCTSRFLMSQPHGDAGGNSVFVNGGQTLHAYWDDLAGTDTTDAYINGYAAQVVQEFVANHRDHPRLSNSPKKWVDESFHLAKSEVYTFGLETGSREHPLMLPTGYGINASRVAREQLALAGIRLASVLNTRLK